MKKRIIGRLIIGILITLIASFLFYVVSAMLFNNYVIENSQEISKFQEILIGMKMVAKDFFIDDILFSVLSLVFLVLSFVSLLAGKTEAIYWVDSVHYHLIEPQFFSIIDMAAYLFGALICCFFAYLFPNLGLEILAVGSFLMIVVFLSFMSFKLLISFFCKDNTKLKLKKDYENALLFRKWVYSCVGTQGEEIPNELYMYSEQFGYHDEIVSRYEELERYPNRLRGKKEKKYIDLYRKKYGYDIYSFAKMRDGLFENLQECIEKNDITNIIEQIAFLAEYHEYNLVFFALDNLTELCPVAIPKALNKLVPIISQCHNDNVDYIYNQLFKYLENIAHEKNYVRICNHMFYESIEKIIEASRDEIFSSLMRNISAIVFSSKNISARQQEDLCSKVVKANINRVENKIIDSYCNDDLFGRRTRYEIYHSDEHIMRLELCISLKKFIKDIFVAAIDENRADLAASVVYQYVCFLERIALVEETSVDTFVIMTSQKHLFRKQNREIYERKLLENSKVEVKLEAYLYRLGYDIIPDITRTMRERPSYQDVLDSENGIENINCILALCTQVLDLMYKRLVKSANRYKLIGETCQFIKNFVHISKDYDYTYADYEGTMTLIERHMVAKMFKDIWREIYCTESEITNQDFKDIENSDSLRDLITKMYYNCTYEEL